MAPIQKQNAKKQADVPPLIIEVVKYLRRVIGSGSTVDRAKWSAEKQKRIAALEMYVNQQMQINLTSWKIEMGEAINLAAYPAQEESRIYWYIALAGNLLWAATCLLAPPAAAGAGVIAVAAEAAATSAAVKSLARESAYLETTQLLGLTEFPEVPAAAVAKAAASAEARQSRVIELMTFTGAILASDTVKQVFHNRDIGTATPKDGKDIVRTWLGRQRAELEEIYKEGLTEWALQLDEIRIWESLAGGQEPIRLYDKHIWTQMFPRTAYDNDRFNAIRDMARNKVQGVLADYNRQWQKFTTDRMMPQYNQAYAQWAMGTLAVPSKTFEAKLNFNLD